MSTDKYVKKYLSKDEAEFLKTDLSPWDHESPPDTYQARRFDDDSGHRRGANWDDTDSHGLRNKLPDEAGDGVHGKLNVLIDNERDQPAGKWLGGGGPVSDNDIGINDGSAWKGSGRKGPRYAPKTGPQGNMKRPR